MSEGKPGSRPRETALVRYADRIYERDLELCRRALWQRIKAGDFRSMAHFAAVIGVPKASIPWFLSARRDLPMDQINAVLAGLAVSFDDVHQLVTAIRPCQEEEP